MVDLVGQEGIEIAKGIVRERGQVNDRIEAGQVPDLDVSNVEPSHRYGRHPVAERGSRIEIAIEPDDRVAGPEQHGDEDRSEVAEMPSDEDALGVDDADVGK
jgi:hypothetical protein